MFTYNELLLIEIAITNPDNLNPEKLWKLVDTIRSERKRLVDDPQDYVSEREKPYYSVEDNYLSNLEDIDIIRRSHSGERVK